MRIATVTVTAATAEPVSRAEAKAHLRILHEAEDDIVDMAVAAARSHLEQRLGRVMIRRTLRGFLPAFPEDGVIELPNPPLVSVVSVTYRDAQNVSRTLASDAYTVLTESEPGRIELVAAPPPTYETPNAVTVEFTAGDGTAGADVPEDLRFALLMLVDHFYHNRGATTEGAAKPTPMAVDYLTDKYRTHGWI